jgi:hypothetical protein
MAKSIASRLEVDLDDRDLNVHGMRKMLRAMAARSVADKDDEENDEELDEAEDEREKLADMHEETKGKGPSIPVKEEDLPGGVKKKKKKKKE